jgi:hypothetical protein
MLDSMKSLINCESPPSSGSLFRTLKVVQKLAMTCTYTGKNQPTKEKESRNRNSNAASGTIFRINKCFKKTSRKVRFEI